MAFYYTNSHLNTIYRSSFSLVVWRKSRGVGLFVFFRDSHFDHISCISDNVLFLQSASQEQSSSNIHTQVGKLVGVVENIELSKEQLTGTLEHLACVSNKLDESLTRQGLLHNEVVNLSNLFVDMNGSKTQLPIHSHFNTTSMGFR